MKICFKCNELKPLNEYYKHKKMSDGHLNKCKDCTKKDVHKHRGENIEKVRAYDRNRPNKSDRAKKSHDYHKTEKGKSVRFLATRNYRSANPARYKANTAVGSAIRDGRLKRPDFCEKCGIACKPSGHHDDYSKPLNVRWLCLDCHKEFHLFIRDIHRNLEHLGIKYPFEGE